MRVLIHPGYPKTASTFLKDNLFSNHSEINFMTKSKIISDKLNLIKFLDKNEFDNEKRNISNFFKNNLLKNRLNILSDEMLLIPLGYKLYDNIEAIKRLHSIFIDIEEIEKINYLIMLRKPHDLILSYYTDEYHRLVSYDKKLEKFQNFLKHIELDENIYTKKILQIFDYYKIIKHIDSLKLENPKSEIGIFLLENLKNNNKNFSKKLSDFLGIDYEETYQLLKKASPLNTTTKAEKYYYRKYDWNIFFSKFNFFYKIIPNKIIRIIKSSKFFNLIWFFKKSIIVKYEEEDLFIVNNLYSEKLKNLEKSYDLELKKNNYY